MNKNEKQPKRPVSDDVDQDSLGQNPQWPGEGPGPGPKKIKDDNGGETEIPLVR